MIRRATPQAFLWLTLSIGLLLFTLVGSSAWWLMHAAQKLSTQAHQVQTARTAQGVVLAVIDDWVIQDYGAVETTLKRAFSNAGVIALTLTDTKGRVIASVKRDPETDTVKVEYGRRPMTVPEQLTTQYVTLGAQLQQWMPVKSGVALGWLVTTTRDQSSLVLNQLGEQTLRLAVIAAVVIFAAFIVVLRIAYRVIAQAELKLVYENERLGDQVSQDGLTGLLNRNGFQNRLTREIEYQKHFNDHGLAVCFLDLDGFKPINDQFGHATGDEVLRIVAKRIRSCVKNTDVVGRYAGDEFLVALNHMSEFSEIKFILRRLQRTIGKPIEVNDQVVNVKLSIGVTIYPHDTSDAQGLMQHADEAMYQAKRSGGNGWAYWTANVEAPKDVLGKPWR